MFSLPQASRFQSIRKVFVLGLSRFMEQVPDLARGAWIRLKLLPHNIAKVLVSQVAVIAG